MAFNLDKGAKFNLTKDGDGNLLKTIRAELGWETPENVFPPFDLDVSMFGLRKTAMGSKLINEDYFVFYNHESKNTKPNITTNDGAVIKSPDELSGGTEWIKVNLDKVDPTAEELSFVVTIHEAKKRHQSFKQVKTPYIEIFNDDTNDLICRFQLEDFGNETAVQVGSLIREGNEWIFEAVGLGFPVELGDIVNQYVI